MNRTDYLALEYKALRDEIVKRIELRQQVVIASATIAGAFLAIGVQWEKTMVVMVYPFIASFLVIAWGHHDISIGRMGKFIREYMENYLVGIENDFAGWETHKKITETERWRLASKSHCGLFLSTQIMAIVVGAIAYATQPRPLQTTTMFIILAVADAVSVFLVITYMWRTRTRN